MKRIILTILLVLPLHALCSSSVLAGKITYQIIEDKKSYLCVADKAAGFVFHKTRKKWESTKYKTDSKYILKKINNIWVVKDFGSKDVRIHCKNGFNKGGTIWCSEFGKFIMNTKNLRYIFIHEFGYVNPEFHKKSWGSEGKTTPFMEIGKCSSF